MDCTTQCDLRKCWRKTIPKSSHQVKWGHEGQNTKIRSQYKLREKKESNDNFFFRKMASEAIRGLPRSQNWPKSPFRSNEALGVEIRKYGNTLNRTTNFCSKIAFEVIRGHPGSQNRLKGLIRSNEVIGVKRRKYGGTINYAAKRLLGVNISLKNEFRGHQRSS